MPSRYTPDLTPSSRELEIGGDEFHHIAHVMRNSVGDVLLLTNGAGVMADAVIEQMGKRSLRARVTAVRAFEKSIPRVACAFCLLRGKHDHLVVEKLTELGVAEFFPFVSERAVRKPGGNTLDKFDAVAVAAMKQCDGAFLPVVHDTASLEKAVSTAQQAGYTVLIASESERGEHLPHALDEITGDVCLVIGPEGGWSDAEKAWFASAGLRTVGLGNHILRAETAAIAGVGMIVAQRLRSDPSFY